MARQKVLIIDDDQHICKILKEYFQFEGYDVVIANNGKSGLEKVDDELKKIERSGMLPAGAVLTGAGSHLPGLIDTAKQKLRLPVSLGSCKNVSAVIEKVHYPEFLNALGLVVSGTNQDETYSSKKKININIDNLWGKLKDFSEGLEKPLNRSSCFFSNAFFFSL